MINIKLLIEECDKLLKTDDKTESIILALNKIKKLIKKEKLDVSNLMFYVKDLINKIKYNIIDTNNITLDNTIRFINYTLSNNDIPYFEIYLPVQFDVTY